MMGRGKDGRTTAHALAAAMAGLGLATREAWALVHCGIGRLAAQTAGVTATFEGKPHRYTVTLPAGCRHEEGPGHGRCDLRTRFRRREERGHQRDRRSAAGGGGRVARQRRTTRALPASCSATPRRASRRSCPRPFAARQTGRGSRSRISSQSVEDRRVVYTADVVCAEVRFLQIGGAAPLCAT